MTLESGVGANWFSNNVARKVSNGRGTSFWKDKWIGEQPLASIFPRLYSISTQSEAKVRDLRSIIDGEVVWNFPWRRQPFLRERNLIGTLLALIGNVNLGVEEDRWVWTPE